LKTSEPVKWEVRKRPRPSTKHAVKVLKRVRPELARLKSATAVKMSHSSWPGESAEHDFYADEPLMDDVAIPSSNIDDLHSDSDNDEGDLEAKSLDLQIKKLELKKAKILVAQRRLQGEQPAERQYHGGTTQHNHGHSGDRRTNDSDLRSHRRQVERQLMLGASEREHRGKKRYEVEVDMKGNPCGQNRQIWMSCLRGHSQDVDFSVDNYNQHSTTMLLAIKQRVDNTFDYEGGLGRVTEEAFHSLLKNQLKTKRYQLKKALVAGKPKPKHIRQDHWLNLSKLIMEERKIKEAQKLRSNRAQVKKASTSTQQSDEVVPNQVEQGGSRIDRGSLSSRQSKMGSDRDIHKRIDGLEENMKLILAALKIDQRGSAPPPSVARAGDTSSSADNVEKGCRGDIGGDTMKEVCTDVMLAKKVSNS
jgi:hypothetical protein